MSSEEPRNLVEHAADAGLKAIVTHLAHADAHVVECFILLHAGNVPTGEPDTVTAGDGFDDARDLVAFVAAHFVGAAAGVGLRVDIIPVEVRGEG